MFRCGGGGVCEIDVTCLSNRFRRKNVVKTVEILFYKKNTFLGGFKNFIFKKVTPLPTRAFHFYDNACNGFDRYENRLRIFRNVRGTERRVFFQTKSLSLLSRF